MSFIIILEREKRRMSHSFKKRNYLITIGKSDVHNARKYVFSRTYCTSESLFLIHHKIWPDSILRDMRLLLGIRIIVDSIF